MIPVAAPGACLCKADGLAEEHNGKTGDIAVYGQESNPTTWRLAMMNLAIRGIDANLGGQNADSFHNDLHKDLRADFLLANPPFNMSDWGGQRLKDDARKMGSLIDRIHRDFSDEEIDTIAGTYHAWRGEKDAGEYQDVPGFCMSATIKKIKEHGYVLTPGRYVGAAEIEDDGIPFEEKMTVFTAQLYDQFAKADQLEAVIKRNLEVLGYGK